MFYSEIFTIRKNCINVCQRTPHIASTIRNRKVIKKVSPRCSYILEFAMLILTYFKPKDNLPNPKGPCRCRFHGKR